MLVGVVAGVSRGSEKLSLRSGLEEHLKQREEHVQRP